MFWSGIGSSVIFAVIGHVLLSHFEDKSIFGMLCGFVAVIMLAISLFTLACLGWIGVKEVMQAVGILS